MTLKKQAKILNKLYQPIGYKWQEVEEPGSLTVYTDMNKYTQFQKDVDKGKTLAITKQ